MKRTVPLKLLKLITPYLNQEKIIVLPKGNNDDIVLHLKENRKDSDFYFKIEKYFLDSFEIFVKPFSEESIELDNVFSLTMEIVMDHLNNWLKIIDEYDSIITIYDDPIVASYQKEYYSKLKFSDEESDVEPYTLEQQQYLNEYLDKVIEQTKKYKNSKNKVGINEIQSDAAELKEDLTKYSKNQVIKKLSFIWAKAQKINLELIKHLFFQLTTEFAKKLLIGP